MSEEITLDPKTNQTGSVWHVFLKGDFKDILYAYKFDGEFSPQQGHYFDSSRLLLDPYAKVPTFHFIFNSLNFALLSLYIWFLKCNAFDILGSYT